MPENNKNSFNHLKIHSQYSICEGALKIEDLKNYCKEKKIQAVGLSDTLNLCGALEFAENLSKVGTQPIIGTQINFKYKETVGLLPLFAMNLEGYKKIIKLSSKSYLENDGLLEPHCNFSELIKNTNGIAIFSGSIGGLIGKLFNQGKYEDISEIYSNLNFNYKDRFYIEIQRHNDFNEKEFEKYNLQKSKDLDIPIIATNEVFYLDQIMHEAHDALICIGNKTYVNEKNRKKYSNQHYLKTDNEMSELFFDIPEALENNYNFPIRCNFKPEFSKPILPNISSDKGGNADEILTKESCEGLEGKFLIHFNKDLIKIKTDDNYKKYKERPYNVDQEFLNDELWNILKDDYIAHVSNGGRIISKIAENNSRRIKRLIYVSPAGFHNPNLNPEESDNMNIGAIWKPTDRLSMKLDYFIRPNDRLYKVVNAE